MSGGIPYLGMDRAALDGQYNNRELVPGHADITGRWERDSAALRQTARCRLDVPFGDTPAEVLDIFLPAGPMTSGLPNDEKSKVRQQYATGEVGRDA